VTRNIGLNISTANEAEWKRTYRTVSGVAQHFGEHGQYVSVWSSATDEEVDSGVVGEDTFYDENTLPKVMAAVEKAVLNSPAVYKDGPEALSGFVNDILTEIQNAGILFRERAK
jgi:hypothetical protein